MAGKAGLKRPCGWCGKPQTASSDRAHWKKCRKRPKPELVAKKKAVSR